MRVLLFVLPLQARLGRETADGWLQLIEQLVELSVQGRSGTDRKELDASAASLLLQKLASSVASLLLREHTERAVLKQGAGYSRPPILAILVRSAVRKTGGHTLHDRVAADRCKRERCMATIFPAVRRRRCKCTAKRMAARGSALAASLRAISTASTSGRSPFQPAVV